MPRSKNKKKSRSSSSKSSKSSSSYRKNKNSSQKNDKYKNSKETRTSKPIQKRKSRSRDKSLSSSHSQSKKNSSRSSSNNSSSNKFDKKQYVEQHQSKKFNNIVKEYHKFAEKNKYIIQQQFQYSAESNPFADKELHKPFIWKKGLENKQEEINAEYLQKKTMQQVHEIQKQRELRKIRELEKEQLEEDKIRFAQDRQDDTYEQWMEKQKKFQFEQEQRRAEERIKQGRPIWVDYFFQVVRIMKGQQQYNPHFDKFIKYPMEILMWLNQADLEQLFNQSKVQQIFEEDEKYKKYWDCIINIVQYLIDETQEGSASDQKQKQEQKFKNPMLQYNNYDRAVDKESIRRTLLKKEYDEDINNMISDKNLEELETLKKEIEETQTNNDFKLDMEFWNCVSKRIDQKIAILNLAFYQTEYYKNKAQVDQKYDIYQKTHKELNSDDEMDEEYEKGMHSPVLIELQEGIQCISAEQDLKNLQALREKIFKQELMKVLENLKKEKEKKKLVSEEESKNSKKKNNQKQEEVSSLAFSEITNDREIAEQIRNFQKSQPTQKDEEKFDDAIKLVQNYSWIDKYQPKKPQYFNRVKTGFFWNVYYRTHYDQDNPPPKVIQGYKFNIFYPDLIDKNSTPQYELQALEDPEYCLIIFKGGPPYEDIAFKIINKEWDFSDKKGFKCLFARGILHLYFNFRVYRSRR